MKKIKNSGLVAFGLEWPGHFFSEKRTELYKWYCLGVSQLKNVLGAHSSLSLRASAVSSAESAHPSESKTKNGWQNWALPNFRGRGEKSMTFYCFSPGVMLATFTIEVSYILYILLRYKASSLTRIAIAMLTCLASFQLTEYFICDDFVNQGEIWPRIGFISITLLPPLAVHLVYTIVGRGWNKVIALAYGTGLAWIGFFMFFPDVFGINECAGNYAIFNFNRLGGIYFVYYYFWLFIGTLLSLNFWLKAKNQQKIKRPLLLFIVSYLGLLLPTMIVNMINPETQAGIPSVMCGFAIIMASVIALYIIPKLAHRKKF